MTRDELTADSRFRQSMEAIARDQSRRSPYGLFAQTGISGTRNAQTGLAEFTAADGVTSPSRDLRSGSQPTGHEAAQIQINSGTNYVR